MIHPVTRQEIPVICKKKDCAKKHCLIKYRSESKFCESYEKCEDDMCDYTWGDVAGSPYHKPEFEVVKGQTTQEETKEPEAIVSPFLRDFNT